MDSRPSPAPVRSEPSAIASSAPIVAYRGQLIAPIGWSDITREQLHAHYFPAGANPSDPENAAIGEHEDWLVKQCMADHGFLYDPLRDSADIHSLPVEQRNAFTVAEYGPETNAPYDWRTAGCYGRAVHLSGQDDAH